MAKNNLLLWYRDTLLPRCVWLPYAFTRIVLEILNVGTWFRFSLKKRRPTILCLEAGIQGWELIEYKELLASAIEYVGQSAVRKIDIDRNQPYVHQVLSAIRTHHPTHYVYDSRTGSAHWLLGLIQSIQVSVLFQVYGVVPICVLTDLPIRAWRAQTAVVSAKRGVVISLMAPRDVDEIFPHRRLIGPITMAFSRATFARLRERDTVYAHKHRDKTLIFTGSLYEPRTSILRKIEEGLASQNITLQLRGRALGSQRFSDDEYWEHLASATMVITTANLYAQSGADWPWVSHLIYRYLEVSAAGSVLVAQPVPSLTRYLEPDVHYIAYSTPEEAVVKISYYWNNPTALHQIAVAGRQRIAAIVEANVYWLCVDTALQCHSLL